MQELALAVLRRVAERTARTGFLDTPAGRLRFAVRGERGPELLLLHGLGDSLAGWAQVVPRLARTHRVHLLDLPGHGLSSRPPDWRLATLLSAVAEYARGLSRPILAGHSLGGWLAAKLALQGNAAGLVLINPAGATLDRQHWEPFRALVSAQDRAGVERYLAHAFHKPPLALRLFPGEVIKTMWSDAAQGILGALTEADFLESSALEKLRLPARLVWGSRDRLLPPGTLKFFQAALPDADLVLLEEAGHLPHFESPHQLADALASPL